MITCIVGQTWRVVWLCVCGCWQGELHKVSWGVIEIGKKGWNNCIWQYIMVWFRGDVRGQWNGWYHKAKTKNCNWIQQLYCKWYSCWVNNPFYRGWCKSLPSSVISIKGRKKEITAAMPMVHFLVERCICNLLELCNHDHIHSCFQMFDFWISPEVLLLTFSDTSGATIVAIFLSCSFWMQDKAELLAIWNESHLTVSTAEAISFILCIFLASLLLPHNNMYNPQTINAAPVRLHNTIYNQPSRSVTNCVTYLLQWICFWNLIALVYLPTVMYSFNTNDEMKATRTSIRGLKADTYKGPFMPTHQANKTKHTPEANIPYKWKTKINWIPHNLVTACLVSRWIYQKHCDSDKIIVIPNTY